ncbi:peptidoglycan-binding domain-containing protein [Thalassotalea mangrovi]|uniref:Peptidoglycan-binding protein n=1 Tax=Thalassotalea mangrovi TaxID=2572245 RepID=A0A4U1B5J7_9GAMM|nr:peptidoglycan-binding domain-containing protein [Thalassotalea mangrovi]TKB45688.1 peptidoglycan-binding protein [Thalassotalea mangrovi]
MYKRMGSKGEEVKNIQEILLRLGYNPGPDDGAFGSKTESAIIQFQEDNNLYADGIVGPTTWEALRVALEINLDEQNLSITKPDLIDWVRVPADPYRNGYNRFLLREDAAKAYLNVREVVVEAGGQITSSGARRSLTASVSASRSATSFHYTGRAIDLFVGSGMENRHRDPFVVVPEEDRYWRVYARADGGEQMELNAVTYGSRKSGKAITGKFIDLTALFEQQGFKRIKARGSFFQGGSWLGAEWWHFQYEKGLKKGVTTFGDELAKVYTEEQLEGTSPWKFKDRTFGVDWF